ncbi:MAG: hypothetical protein C4342_07140, partial [Armatimonadota bacterium]
MYEYIETRRCRMRFLAEALDDVSANDCGRCDNCNLRTMPVPAREKVLEAIHFLKRDHQVIAPKKFFPPGVKGVGREAIPHQEQLSQGAALSVYNDAGWGRLVREAKYSRQAFPDELIPPAVELIAQGVAEAAVDAGYAVVSGGAKGIDQVSMRAAYNAGGDSIGFLAESLVKQVRKQGPAAFEDGLVCLATCYAPDAPFSVGNAMGRNKLVYGHATATVVVSAARGSGGAWAG